MDRDVNASAPGVGDRRTLISGDPDYDSMRATFNAMIDRHPAQIDVCSTADEVVDAVKLARRRQLPISIRGGGHGIAGHCSGDAALVIDLRGMRHIKVDPQARTAVAQGGATWEDYDTATQRFGLASTGGTFTDTGVAGLTLGGGIGYLQGTQGFAVDTLIGIRIVTADGQLVNASADENPDLFWAVRGAGANFGVVVEFKYRVRPVTALYGGMISYGISAAAEVLRLTRDLAENGPDELTLQCVVGRRILGTTVLACFQGPESEGERLLKPLRRAGQIEADALRPLSYAEMQATNPLLPFGLRHYWKGHFLHDLPDDMVEMSAEHIVNRPASGFGSLLIEFIGGAPLRVPVDSMAFNQRDARVNASALGIWADAANDGAHIVWGARVRGQDRPARHRGGVCELHVRRRRGRPTPHHVRRRQTRAAPGAQEAIRPRKCLPLQPQHPAVRLVDPRRSSSRSPGSSRKRIRRCRTRGSSQGRPLPSAEWCRPAGMSRRRRLWASPPFCSSSFPG